MISNLFYVPFACIIFILIFIKLTRNPYSKTIYNNETGYYSVLNSGETGTVTGSIDGENVLTINGETITSTGQRYVLMSNSFYLRYSGTAHELRYWDESSSTTKNVNHVPVEFTAENGVLTYTDNSTDPATVIEVAYEWIAYNTQTPGDYRDLVVGSTDRTIYVNDIKQIYGVAKYNELVGMVSIGGGVIGKTYEADEVELSVTPHEINNVLDVVSLTINTGATSDIQYVVTSEGTTTGSFGGNILVPHTVVGISDPPGKEYIEMLEIIPILVIIGLIMGIVGMIASRRFE